MKTSTVRREVAARIPTRHGTFQLMLFTTPIDNKEHMALVMGDVRDKENVIVRVHSECFTGDVLGSVRCDCGEQLEGAMQMVGQAKQGVILYLRQEGRGIGLLDKLRAYNLQDEGLDTVEANLRLGHEPDERDYTVAALMLADLGIRSVRLITNNPKKINDLRRLGVIVQQRMPIEVPPRPENLHYLRTKAKRMDHLLQLVRRA
ncbi:MAG TPA: GTP cyclohydrolase II [Anaerolineales bacterium]|nr:GTP cyclohydrolase II [Anaerolineales bacterium]